MGDISIIGCGWLGLALGQSLAQKGYQVRGSTTQKEKLNLLECAGIKPTLFKLNPMPEGKAFKELFESETLFINVPPGRKKNPPEFYREQIKYLRYMLAGSKNVKRVIFISSTSYYPNTDEVVDELTQPDIEKGSSKAVVWAEKEIKQIKQELIILRCGGLMGENRIPGKWFAAKETSSKDNPTNYIHRDDIIHETISLLGQSKWPPVKNLVSQSHYARQVIVEQMARKYRFEAPKWVTPNRTSTKVVKSQYDLSWLIDPFDY